MAKRYMVYVMVVLATILAATGMYAGTKSVATVTGVDKVIIVTLPAPYNETVYAGTFHATVDGNATSLYCIDISHPLAENSAYNDVSQTDATLSYILNNYYPYRTGYSGSLSPVESEAGAVQLALWHFTDALDINSVSGDATVKARALAIVADAVTNAHSFNLNTFAINLPPQTFTVGTPVTFTVQAFNESGLAMANVQIALSTSAGTLSSSTTTTGVNGVSSVITLTPSANLTSATITATGVVGIPSGTKYYNTADPNGKQKLILAKATTASRTITQAVNWSAPLVINVEKTADRPSCADGDFINYTIKVINSGLSNATNVRVSDQLSAALQFVSCTPSGAYNSGTGIWTVGTVNAGETKTLVLKAQAHFGSHIPAFDLGVAKDYNVFVLDTITSSHCDTQGKLAVGGYADLSGYSVGDQLPAHSGNVLVVGKHLSFLVGRVYNGKAVYGKYITSTTGFSADDGIFQDSTIIDFDAAKIYMENLSNQLSLLSANGSEDYQYGHLALTGTDPAINIFKIDGSKLSTINDFSVTVPAGATAIVNINGNGINWHGGFEVNGTTQDKVLLNFYNATSFSVSGIDVKASILAPYATFTFPVGLVSGQVIAKSICGSGQFNLVPFTGTANIDTTIANVALLANADQASMKVLNRTLPSFALVSENKITAVKSESLSKPTQFKLEQNYPNPFNPSTAISYSVAKREHVNISVYAIDGRLVETLVNGDVEPGNYSAKFNASNLNSGVYFYRFTSNSFNTVRKMILMK